MRTLALLLFVTVGSFCNAKAEDIHLRIAPNPASSSVVLTMPELAKGSLTLEVFTVLGTKVIGTIYQVEMGTNSININISQLPEGIYLVRVSQNGKTSAKRLKVQHSEY